MRTPVTTKKTTTAAIERSAMRERYDTRRRDARRRRSRRLSWTAARRAVVPRDERGDHLGVRLRMARVRHVAGAGHRHDLGARKRGRELGDDRCEEGRALVANGQEDRL